MVNRKTTKDKILHILKKDEEVPMKELVHYLSISEVAVRKHIRELIRQELVSERTVKNDIGRPYYLYALTRKGHHTFPNEYHQLPTELLKDLELSQGEEVVGALLRTRKEREKEELEQYLEATAFDERVEKLVNFQEERGYMIEKKETDEGHMEIKNFNCPIYNLASNYTIICQNEKEMYEELFPNSDVKSRECMTKGGNHCCWLITNPKVTNKDT